MKNTKTPVYTALQIREIFHIEFLRWFSRKMDRDAYALKGGTNLRFYFKSIRYSEDMDLDLLKSVGVERLKKTVMNILTSTTGFGYALKSFGIASVIPPDMTKAKQTETTQRFKVHLLTEGGDDLFTKIEFSRRGFKGRKKVETISTEILRDYKMVPFPIPHYDAPAAITQKIEALAGRAVLQARDIFDLYILQPQIDPSDRIDVDPGALKRAYDNLFQIDFPQFRDSVVAYLSSDDQKTYSAPADWDEMKLQVGHFLEGLGHGW